MVMKAKSKPVAKKGAGSGMRAKNIRSGGFLDDIDVEVTGARYTIDEFEGTVNWDTDEKGTVHKNVLRLDLESPDKANIKPKDWGVGSWVPSYDGETPATQDPTWDPEVGAMFLCAPEGGPCTGLHGTSHASILITRLVDDCGWDDSRLDDLGAEAFLGLQGHTRDITIKAKGKKKDQTVTVFERIDNQKSAGAKQSDAKAASITKKPKPAPVEEEEQEQEEEAGEELDLSPQDEAEQNALLVSGVITEALRKLKGKPILKAQLPALINRDKSFAQMEQAERSELAKLSVSDLFLKAGAKDGAWTWNGREVGPAEAV